MKQLINSSMAFVAAIALYTTADAIAQPLEPFTFRAPLDPYRIHQPPDFKIHSRARTDLVIQRSVFAPGLGGWHIHPGPSFVYVVEGQIKLQKFTKKNGCFETPVFGPGQAYYEVGNEVHRAVVVSEESAVLMVVRFNIPEGGALSTPVADPGCPQPTGLFVAEAAPLNAPLEADFIPKHASDPVAVADVLTPFTFRAPLDPYRIHQRPGFLIRSRAQTDLVIQRSVFAPGPGPWHIHPGPSFVYVIEGQIKIQKSTKKQGCFETAVYGPGQAYYEVANEVHRAVVVSEASAVLMVVRFNIPVGAPITILVPDPGCSF